MRRPIGVGLAVAGVFAVCCGASIDLGMYGSALASALVTVVIIHVGLKVWQ